MTRRRPTFVITPAAPAPPAPPELDADAHAGAVLAVVEADGAQTGAKLWKLYGSALGVWRPWRSLSTEAQAAWTAIAERGA